MVLFVVAEEFRGGEEEVIQFVVGQRQVGGDVHEARLLVRIRDLCQAGVDEVDVGIGRKNTVRSGRALAEFPLPLRDGLTHELGGVGGIAVDGYIDQRPAHPHEAGDFVQRVLVGIWRGLGAHQ